MNKKKMLNKKKRREKKKKNNCNPNEYELEKRNRTHAQMIWHKKGGLDVLTQKGVTTFWLYL